MIFGGFKEAGNHISTYMKLDTPCRQKILDLCNWLYSSGWKIKSYPVNEPGIRFCLFEPGKDHFLCVKYGKNCAELHFYKIPPIKDYMKLVSDNKNWTRIKGGDIDSLPIDEIKNYIKLAFRNRV
jgi:hypothetical protein